MLDNIKHGRPTNYDAENIQNQKTTTLTQILSDGSVIYQHYAASLRADSDAQILSSKVENKFGLGELSNIYFR